mmetsp:Transcript_24832/g.74714  ORF Transcript_24832/g.74714 Transcript_24832/m.74714 type:complete len:368 (+) Transcript_24832:126-1229(+)
MLALLLTVGTVQAAPPSWTWDTVQTFVHCSNNSGPLNHEIAELMANSSFAVIEKYMCLECAPCHTGAEGKVLAAAATIREINPQAAIFFYFAVDYTRTWYDLGTWFDEHPALEVHNADGTLATRVQTDNGDNTWHIFDFSKAEALDKWTSDIAEVVTRGKLDGIFIDGYRGKDAWVKSLIPHANSTEAAAWLEAAWVATGTALAKTLPSTIRIPNGNPQTTPPPGYNAISIEFFGLRQIELLQQLGENETFVEVHSYIGDDRAAFNMTLAAYLVGVGKGAYFGAGNTWDTCESWLIDYQLAEYSKPLGEPLGSAQATSLHGGMQYTRKFATGTHVRLWVSNDKDAKTSVQSCVWWSDGSMTGNDCAE